MANINHSRKNTGSETTILNLHGNSSPNCVKLRTLNADASYCQLSSSLSYKDRPKNIKIIHQNICGILHKTDELLVPLEKSICYGMETSLTFVDLRKAYDTVPINKLWNAMRAAGINCCIWH